MDKQAQNSQQILDLLQEVFDQPFSLWKQQRSSWTRFHGTEESYPEKVIDGLKRLDHFDRPTVQRITSMRAMTILPIDGVAVENVAAVGFPVMESEDSLARVANTAFQLLQARFQVAQQQVLITELNQAIEEGFWLRELSRDLELSDANQPVDSLARVVLPQLKDLIRADSIGFVPLPDLGLQSVWVGDEVPGPARSESLIDQYGDAAQSQPFVSNDKGPAISDDDVRNLILVPVASRKSPFGWLMAVNRTVRTQENVPFCPSESEFGTVEASLVATAATMLATHANNVELFTAKERLVVGVIRAMSGAVDARDPYTKGHSDRVARYSRLIAQELGLSEADCKRVYLAGVLHDIGKIGVPDEVLLKPRRLSESEYATIQRHPEVGFRILREIDELSSILTGVLHHHETVDGGGYPHQLVGEDIPLDARIIAVADAFDAMTSCRPYRDGMPFPQAEAVIVEAAGRQFDERVVEAFSRVLPEICEIAEVDRSRNSSGPMSNSVLDELIGDDHSMDDSISLSAAALHLT